MFGRDALASTTEEPLSLFTSLLLLPPEHVDECAAFVAGLLQHLHRGVSEAVAHFQAIEGPADRIHARCSLLFVTSLRFLLLKNRSASSPVEAAFVFVVFDRYLRSTAVASDGELRAQLVRYARSFGIGDGDGDGDGVAASIIVKLADPVDSSHDNAVDEVKADFPLEVVGLWFPACLLYTSPSPRDRG